jgi:hypothetical protein
MNDDIKKFLNDILYHLENINQQGFSNRMTKLQIHKNIKSIANVLNLKVNEDGGYLYIGELEPFDDDELFDDIMKDYETMYEE